MENKQNLNQNMDFLTFLKEINKLQDENQISAFVDKRFEDLKS